MTPHLFDDVVGNGRRLSLIKPEAITEERAREFRRDTLRYDALWHKFRHLWNPNGTWAPPTEKEIANAE
jgi:hypothetical protein